MSRRSKQILFFIAYVIVLIQLFEIFLATVGLASLGAPAIVRTASIISILLMGLALVIVMIVRPMLEREFIADGWKKGYEARDGHDYSRAVRER